VPGWPRTARDPGWAPLRRHHPGRRRLAAAGLAAGSVAAALQVLAPRPPAGEAVVVAAREVPAGAVLAPADLAVVRRPPSLPSGAVADRSAAVGRTVGSGLRPGEPLTDARLVGPGLLVGRPPGDVAAPVRIADGEAAALLRAGDRVDVLQAFGADAGGGGGGGSGGGGSGSSGSGERSARAEGGGASLPRARTVVRRATVLARPGLPAGGGLLPEADPSAGGLIVLAVDEREAAALAEAAVLGPLALVLRPGS
jgi:pilus assembly protein CpaB